jgi:Methyltransferase domain
MGKITLDDLGIRHGTDKSVLNHDYLRHYERILAPFQSQPITLLEIGVFRGESLAMWEEWFPKAAIVGVDIHPECAQYAGGRREVEIGSQADAAFLNDLGQRRKPHVIIDDGSHRADHIQLTFETLFPHLQPGGVYIIEDVAFHSGWNAHVWRGEAKEPPQDMMLRIARLVTCFSTEGDEGREFARQIDSVVFIPGAIAVRKRAPLDSAYIRSRRSLVETANKGSSWRSYAMRLFHTTRDGAAAIECARRALELDPKDASNFEILSVLLEQTGDIVAATSAIQTAVDLHPADARRKAILKRLQSHH